jgi:transposase
VLESVLATLARHLRERGELDLSECFIDATFVAARSGGGCVGKTKRGKGTKLMAIADCSGLPVAVHAASASPHEVTLVKETLAGGFVGAKPERLIGDRAYDSDPLDASLHAEGIEMIAPHRKGRKKGPTQDGRKLRRYKRRWKVERLFAWLGNFRRLVVRYERRAENYLGFVRLACMVILLRYL